MATTLRVSNRGSASITVDSQAIAPLAHHDFTTTDFMAVFGDLAFRVGLMTGDLYFSINGGLPMGGPALLQSAAMAQFISDILNSKITIP